MWEIAQKPPLAQHVASSRAYPSSLCLCSIATLVLSDSAPIFHMPHTATGHLPNDIYLT